jgi:hypothetical protein
MSTMGEQSEAVATETATGGTVVAKAGRYYRVARYLMTLLLIGYGAWSIYDGFYSWPNWPITHPEEKPKTHTDIVLNQVLGIALPPTGLFILFWALYNSRGEYRLENGVVNIPGHPPIPLDKIHSVNRELWDRKGIAYVDYDLTEAPVATKAGGVVNYSGVTKGVKGTFRLDDFVYEREPTDKIFKAIEDSLLKSASSAPPVQPPAAPKLPPRPKMGTKA